ncbi:TetR family transcriptional regulator [Corynebacterium sp. 335C]
MTRVDPEILLAAADEICAETGAVVRSLPAIVAVAAVAGGRIGGIPLHATEAARRIAVEEAIAALRPLDGPGGPGGDGANRVLARVVLSMSGAE